MEKITLLFATCREYFSWLLEERGGKMINLIWEGCRRNHSTGVGSETWIPGISVLVFQHRYSFFPSTNYLNWMSPPPSRAGSFQLLWWSSYHIVFLQDFDSWMRFLVSIPDRRHVHLQPGFFQLAELLEAAGQWLVNTSFWENWESLGKKKKAKVLIHIIIFLIKLAFPPGEAENRAFTSSWRVTL